jgi:FAD/FMN-containing dehydrogenase
MKRRAFCTSAVSVLTTASIPWKASLAASAVGGDIPALGVGGKQIVLKPADLDDLRGNFRGTLLIPGQDGYETARHLWNGAFDKKPALIARCAGAADVVQSVKFARAHGMLVAVRGGGHSLSGQSVCDGGLMIDLSPMKSVHVDPLAKRARVEPGVLLGAFDREAQSYGLATPAGTISHTGVAGLTLGGGFGRIARRFGLACDNLVAADLITAEGKFVKASAQDNPDLLWALRGGGGNFGVVTSFEYQLHEVNPAMIGGPLVFPFVNGRDLLRAFGDFIDSASDEMYSDASIVPTPNGRLLVLDVCHSGTPAAAEKELAKLRKIGKPVQDGIKPASYVTLQSALDGNFPHGRGYYIKSGFIPTITPQIIDTVVSYLDAAPFPSGVVNIVHQGGAIARVKPDATAFWHRSAQHSVMMIGFWDKPEEAAANMKWVKTGWQKVEPLTNGFYVNEVAHDDPKHKVRATYGDNFPRLLALKKQYDPTNFFRLNANITPDA